MASAGKKSKKVKGKTLALNDFLGDTPVLPPPMPRSKFNWADEEPEDLPAPAVHLYLPTAPRSSRGVEIDESAISMTGPWEAFIFNLPYEIDDGDLADFFQDMNVSAIRVPRDDNTGKPKGFGYVTFGDRESYIGALTLTDTMVKGRRVRIEQAGNERDRRGGMNRGRDRDRDSNYDPERTMGDWRSGPRTEASGPDRPRREYGGMRDGDRDRGGRDGDRDRDRGEGFDGSSWRDAPRRPPMDDRRDDRDRDRGFGGPRRYGDRREPSPPPDLRSRPKLNLKPRTVPADAPTTQDSESAPKADSSNGTEGEAKPARSGANPFGAARPVDTTARERELAAKDPAPSDTNGSDSRPAKPAGSNPFGQARPVDTSARERAIEESLRSRPETKPAEPRPEPVRPARPAAASIFGGAKPVDTAQREREIEEKLAKTRLADTDSKPRDEEKSDEKSDAVEGDKKPESVVPAPAPVENAWAKRAQRSSPPRNASGDRRSPDQRTDENGKQDTERGPPPSRDEPRPYGRGGYRDSDRDYPRGDRDGGRRDDNSRDRDYRRNDRYGDRRNDRDNYSRRDDRDRRDDRRDRDYPRRDRDDNYGRRDGDRRDYDRRDDRGRDVRRDDRDYRRDGDRDYRRDVDRREGDRDYRRDGDRREGDRDYRRDVDRRDDRDFRRDDDRRDDRDSRRDIDRRDDRVSRSHDRDSRNNDRDRDGDHEQDRDDRKAPPVDDKERGSKSGPRDAKDRPPREPRPPREMPKAADASAPNYAQTNKYSFLEEDAPPE